jgi:hypothetical protein
MGVRSDHSRECGEEGRPVREAFSDAQRASLGNVFIQPDERLWCGAVAGGNIFLKWMEN